MGLSTETVSSSREVILRAQLGQTKIRSITYYDILGVKGNELSIISVEFRLAGEFLIKVENGLTKCYETRVVIFQEEGTKVENISFVNMQRGDYTLTITDVKTGQIVSGNFSI